MIVFKDNYNITNEDYNIYVFRKDDISRITYQNKNNTAIVHLKKGTYLEIEYITDTDFLSILRELKVNINTI